MMLLTATWSLGYAALVVSVAILGVRPLFQRHKITMHLAAQAILAISTILLWSSLAVRILRGHGWPFQSPADLSTGIALLLLFFYICWSITTRHSAAGLIVSMIALVLLSYALIQQPLTLSTQPYPSPGIRLGTGLNLAGGAFLALAAATSLSTLANRSPYQAQDANRAAYDRASEAFVRGALFCLAASLAIDTWWLQKVGLGNINDAQQAGIAVTWMVYFMGIRLRTQPDWKGWPWTALVTVGFACTLPILLNVPWLEATLPL
jgi:hypothetical protein